MGADRSNALNEIVQKQAAAYRAQYVGQEVSVLIEETKVINGISYAVGHTPQYIQVALETEENLSNTFVTGIAKELPGADMLLL